MDYEDLTSKSQNYKGKNNEKEKNNVKNKKKEKFSKDEPDDISDLFIHIFKKFNIKIAILLMVFYLFINTSFFMDSVLSGFKDAVMAGTPTEYGILVQAIILSLFYILVSLLNDSDII